MSTIVQFIVLKFLFLYFFKIALVQFALNFNVNSKDDCEEVLIADSFDMNKKSEFINLDELTQVENVMIDAEMTDDLKLQLLRILFSFHSGANELNRATALVSFIFHLMFNVEKNNKSMSNLYTNSLFAACSHGSGFVYV